MKDLLLFSLLIPISAMAIIVFQMCIEVKKDRKYGKK